MNYINNFQIFNESRLSEGLPDYFYLILRASDRDNSNTKPWETLATMKAEGLIGISSTPNIISSWMDVRSILVMMPAEETLRINKIFPVDYYNPDQLVSNNLFLLRRLTDNYNKGSKADLKDKEEIDRFERWEYDSTLTKIFQVRKLSVGKKKASRLVGTWHRDRTHYQQELFETFGHSSFYHKIGDHISNEIQQKRIKINSVNDLVRAMEKAIIDNRSVLEDITYGTHKQFKWFFNYFDKYGTQGFKQVLNWMIIELSRIWVNKEDEWIVKKDKLSGKREFKIPNNSHLIIKTFPGYEDKEVYATWDQKRQQDNKKNNRRDISHGLREDYAKEMVKDYQLNNIYDVHYVENLHEAKELVNKIK